MNTLSSTTSCNVPITSPMLSKDSGALLHIFGAECLVLFVSLITDTAAIRILTRTSILHSNIKYIILLFMYSYLFGLLARVVIILYQWRLFSIEVDQCPSILYIAIFFRCHLLCGIPFMVIMVLLERCFATYYCRDYEISPRKWIFLCLLVPYVVITLKQTFALIYGILTLPMEIAITAVLSITGGFFYYWLYNKNKNSSIGQYDNTEPGYLSRRYQVKENLRILLLLRSSAICVVIVVVITASIIFIALYAKSRFIQLIGFQCFEVLVAVSAISINLFFIFSMQRLKLTRKGFSLRISKKITLPEVSSFEEYFSKLDITWK